MIIDKEKNIENLKKEHEELKKILSYLSLQQIIQQKIIGSWCIKDIIAHLSAWNWEAITEINKVLENHATWPGRYEDEKGEAEFNRKAIEKRKNTSWKEVVSEWNESFSSLIEKLSNLTEHEWTHQSGTQTWTTGRLKGQPVTVYSLFDYEYEGQSHEGGHTKQIKKVLEIK